jgi:hypothetical protein
MKGKYGSVVIVTRKQYDENGVETEDNELVKSYVYTIELEKRIDGYSFADVQISNSPENTSTISVVKPFDEGGIQSSPPLSGKFIVNCPNPDNPEEIA